MEPATIIKELKNLRNEIQDSANADTEYPHSKYLRIKALDEAIEAITELENLSSSKRS